MGTKKMGSKGVQDPKLHSLPRQGSLYSLTLDEVQNQLGDLGKPLSSMNLDEFLKAAGMGIIDDNIAKLDSLHRQPSLMLSWGDLSKKTVDEVWRDIQQEQTNNNNSDRRVHERQPTIGEITLEDFLVKAGIVTESSSPVNKNDINMSVDSIPVPQHDNISQPAQWMQYPHLQQPPPPNMMSVYMPVQQSLPAGANPCMDPAYPEIQMAMSVPPLMGILSDTQTPRKKKVAPLDVVEKTVERRQKRMIKNRESAARSRARKQAYTQELENKISLLEEENERLKKQKEVEKLMICAPPPEPKYQLRRTSSGPL